jgi:cell division protein FtsQ
MARSLVAPARRPPAARRRPPARPAPGALPRLPAPVAAAAARALAAIGGVWRRRRARIALLAVALTLPSLGGAWLWLRHSPFVSVQRVSISGVHGAEAGAVEAALRDAARGMSTLAVSPAALRAAVAPLRVVREVRAIPSFPHGLRIEVVEQLPVAAVTVGGQRTAVAGDGVVLGPQLLSSSLPNVAAAAGTAPGGRVRGASLLAQLAVLGAAPAALLAHVERVFVGIKGITAAMRNGLLVYFGDGTRPHAKWFSLARVLADASSAGASYVDVRVPSHPAAGFPAGVSPPDAAAAATGRASESASVGESTIASLAAGLGGPSSGASASESEGSAAGSGGGAADEAGASNSGSASSGEQQPPAAGGGVEAPPSATSESGAAATGGG